MPSGENDFDNKWRNQLINIVTRDREVDKVLRERLEKENICICQRHYRDDQISFSDTRSTPKPGELPGLNLHLMTIFIVYRCLKSTAVNHSILQ